MVGTSVTPVKEVAPGQDLPGAHLSYGRRCCWLLPKQSKGEKKKVERKLISGVRVAATQCFVERDTPNGSAISRHQHFTARHWRPGGAAQVHVARWRWLTVQLLPHQQREHGR